MAASTETRACDDGGVTWKALRLSVVCVVVVTLALLCGCTYFRSADDWCHALVPRVLTIDVVAAER